MLFEQSRKIKSVVWFSGRSSSLLEVTMKKKLLLFLVLLISPVLAFAAPKADLWPLWQANDPASSVQIDHSAWQRFLSQYLVTDHPSGINRVRYSDVTREDKKSLQDYLDRMQTTEVSRLNPLEQKAFWINLYNAQTVKLILDHYPVDSIRDIDISPGWFSNGPWDAKLLTVEGEQLSLNDIEHRILRPIWQDNRIHYGVNCASIGCPNLQPQPFTAANLDELLEKGAEDYINHRRGLRNANGEITVSSIYDWFQADFGGTEEGVREHLLKYAGPSRAELLKNDRRRFSYAYDWSLNE